MKDPVSLFIIIIFIFVNLTVLKIDQPSQPYFIAFSIGSTVVTVYIQCIVLVKVSVHICQVSSTTLTYAQEAFGKPFKRTDGLMEYIHMFLMI